jgi:Tfp pilus assembly protein PilF
MSDPAKAVFLSYASQDAEAARRICETLRAAGVEVWFDQSELVGGDAWDAKIRQQIQSCALFVPIISANTQARPEGYFRLEWKLAVDRSHLMSDDHPFFLPVVIDDTTDSAARVPARFRERQWIRLPRGETPSAFAQQVKKVLSGTVTAVANSSLRPDLPSHRTASNDPLSEADTPTPPTIPVTRPLLRRWWRAVAAFVLAAAMGIALWQVWRQKDQTPPATLVARSSEARQLIAKARELFEAPEVTNRENILLAERLCDKAVAIDPADAEVWAARAQLSYTMFAFGHDRSAARTQGMVSDAERAMTLAPEAYESRLAVAFSIARQTARTEECERLYRSLLAEQPNDKRVLRNFGHFLRWSGRLEEGLLLFDQAAALPGGDPIALADKANIFYFLGRLTEAESTVERSLAQAPTGRAYLIHTLLQLILRGDTERAKA